MGRGKGGVGGGVGKCVGVWEGEGKMCGEWRSEGRGVEECMG